MFKKFVPFSNRMGKLVPYVNKGAKRINWNAGFTAVGNHYPQLRSAINFGRRFAASPAGKFVKDSLSSAFEKHVNMGSLPHSSSIFRKNFVVQNKGTGVTKSSYIGGKKVSENMSAFLKTCQKVQIKNRLSFHIESGQDKQQMSSLSFITSVDLEDARRAAFQGTGVLSDPAQTTNLTGGDFRFGKQTVGGFVGETYISNTSDINTVVILYDVVAKHDMVTAQVGSNPNAAWSNGVNNSPYDAALGNRLGNVNVLGAEPFESDLFNSYWAISKKTTIELAAGGSHVHTNVYTPYVTLGNYRESSTNSYQDITRGLLVIVKGTPVHSALSHTTVGLGNVGIDVVCDYVYTGYFNNKALTSRTDVSTYAVFADPKAVSDSSIIDEAIATE